MFNLTLKPIAAAGLAGVGILWAALSPAPVHAKPDLQAVFQAIDGGGNGRLSLDEFVNHPANPAIQKLHAPAKGSIHEKMAAMHGKAGHSPPSSETLRGRYAQIDTNDDGSVDIDEFRAFHDGMMDHQALR